MSQKPEQLSRPAVANPDLDALGVSANPPPAAGVEVDSDGTPKVKDVYGRMVTPKSANQPFLAYTEHRAKEAAKAEARAERKRVREEKIARGEDPGPEEKDTDGPTDITLWGMIKTLIIIVLGITLSGYYITGSFTWGYEGKFTHLKTYWPTHKTLFTEGQLTKFDGTDTERPLYLAIDGDVYDVSEGRRIYGPGGSYAAFAGKDAARAYTTGCFQTHLTHDLRGLNEKELKSLAHWKNFFANHAKYNHVGTVKHAPIDPQSPIPEHCNAERAAQDKAEAGKAASVKGATVLDEKAKPVDEKAESTGATKKGSEEL